MDFDEIYKNRVGKHLTIRLALALKSGEITEQELPIIARFILDHIDNILNHEQLIQFLTNLSQKWPIFNHILTIEKGEEILNKEGYAINQIQQLLKQKRYNEAITIAKNIMEKGDLNGPNSD